ncbi:MAG: zf-HC2 domain-containing protein [Candidatus Zixiibacteriota bacterium]
MRCEDFDELIYLFWDGQIEERKKEELEKHLLACKRCKEKLTLLESIEKKAKQVKMKEPSQEYWDTFSSRVRERIIAQKEESFSFKLKKAFEIIFTLSPLKIKIAAGVVSIVFVLIVGRLYVNYKGEDIVPPEPRIENIKKPAPFAPDVTKEISPPEEKIKKEERFAPPTNELEKAVTPQIIPKEEVTSEVVELKEERVLLPETYSTGAGAEEEKKMLEEIAKPEQKAEDLEGIPLKGVTETGTGKPSLLALDRAIQTPRGKDYYVIDEEKVVKIEEEDTLLQEDVLRKTIEGWTRYIEKNPKDSLANEGYLQVAVGYYLLSKLTQDESDLLKGIELLEKYEKRITDQKIKEELDKKLQQLKALKEK